MLKNSLVILISILRIVDYLSIHYIYCLIDWFVYLFNFWFLILIKFITFYNSEWKVDFKFVPFGKSKLKMLVRNVFKYFTPTEYFERFYSIRTRSKLIIWNGSVGRLICWLFRSETINLTQSKMFHRKINLLTLPIGNYLSYTK